MSGYYYTYIPITTDGKAPDLSFIEDMVFEAIIKSVNKAKRNSPKGFKNRSQKDTVLEHLDDGVDKASGGGKHRYSLRQLYYALRPYVIDELGKELSYENFAKIITDFESELGEDLPGIYRDNRGTLYHFHLHETIPLGSKSIEIYELPEWTFNKVLYSEKEGIIEILKDAKWPEKHDCALLTSKGFPSRAARDLIDLMGGTGVEILFFCIHDADASGTLIYQSLQEATAARPERRVRVINLGLEPKEALAMGLEIEHLDKTNKMRPVATYVTSQCEEWLQHNRVELNAMSTPQLIDWLESKMAQHASGKLIPPETVLYNELKNVAELETKRRVKEAILKAQKYDEQVQMACEKLNARLVEAAQSLKDEVSNELKRDPYQSWRQPVAEKAANSVICDFVI